MVVVRTSADRVKGGPGDTQRGRWLEASLKDIYLQKHLEEGRRAKPWVDSVKFIGFFWLVGSVLALLVGSPSALLEANPITLALLYLSPIALLAIAPPIIYLAARIVIFTRTFSEGRGIGTLGLIIAFAGLLLELYQVITVVLSGQPSTSEAPYALKVLVGTAGAMLFAFAVYILVVARKITKSNEL